MVASPKFYYFDVGVVNRLTKRSINHLKGSLTGNAFENYILMELIAHRGLNDLDHGITFWRTRSGSEVDFILGDAEVALEIKISNKVRPSELNGLIEFTQEYKPKKSILVNLAPKAQKIEIAGNQAIDVLPWEDFLKKLWAGQIIN